MSLRFVTLSIDGLLFEPLNEYMLRFRTEDCMIKDLWTHLQAPFHEKIL